MFQMGEKLKLKSTVEIQPVIAIKHQMGEKVEATSFSASTILVISLVIKLLF